MLFSWSSQWKEEAAWVSVCLGSQKVEGVKEALEGVLRATN